MKGHYSLSIYNKSNSFQALDISDVVLDSAGYGGSVITFLKFERGEVLGDNNEQLFSGESLLTLNRVIAEGQICHNNVLLSG